MTLFVVAVFGHILMVRPLPVTQAECMAGLPAAWQSIAVEMGARGRTMDGVSLHCLLPGTVVIGGPAA